MRQYNPFTLFARGLCLLLVIEAAFRPTEGWKVSPVIICECAVFKEKKKKSYGKNEKPFFNVSAGYC
jgi:hypothetical protein